MENPVPMVFDKVAPFLERDRCALVVVDLQEKLLPAIFEKERVLRNTKLLIECAKILKIPVLFTQQYPRGLGETVPAIREVLPPDLLPIDKTEFGCFNNPAFQAVIKQLKPRRNTLLVAGIESHICVTQTALGGVREGFKVHVASDAISSRSDFNWKIGLDRMKDAGGLLSSTEMIIYELLGRSDTPEFKAMLAHLK
ncbi:MAG: hydrolase [Terriglobia bacterium]|jgi:nicotinamidase-related amidase